jgi:hypothetical protein
LRDTAKKDGDRHEADRLDLPGGEATKAMISATLSSAGAKGGDGEAGQGIKYAGQKRNKADEQQIGKGPATELGRQFELAGVSA